MFYYYTFMCIVLDLAVYLYIYTNHDRFSPNT